MNKLNAKRLERLDKGMILIKQYLEKKKKEYTSRGFSDYSDLKQNDIKLCKEIQRCQFLLDTIVRVDLMINRIYSH